MPLDNFDMSFYKDMIARDSNQRIDIDLSIKGTAAIPEEETEERSKKSDKLKNISEDIVILDPEEIDKEVKKIDKTKGKGKKIANLISEKTGESSILENEEEQIKTEETFNTLIQDINKQYNLNFDYSYGSFVKNLESIIDPKQKEAAELILSKTFSAVRLNVYMQLMASVQLLSSQILDPKYITSESINYGDKLLILKELFDFMKSLNEIYNEIEIKDTDMKLEKLGQEKSTGADIDTPEIREFMESFLKK